MLMSFSRAFPRLHISPAFVSDEPPAKRLQHFNATLLSGTCCARLATLLRRVGCCWLKSGKRSNLSQRRPAYRSTPQQGGQTRVAYCTEQCCDRFAGT